MKKYKKHYHILKWAKKAPPSRSFERLPSNKTLIRCEEC